MSQFFAQQTQLREVCVPQNGIKDEGMVQLIESLASSCKSLRILKLNDNFIKKKGMQALIELIYSGCEMLSELDLSDMNMGMENVVVLTRAMVCCRDSLVNLKAFSCCNNEVDCLSLVKECLNNYLKID